MGRTKEQGKLTDGAGTAHGSSPLERADAVARLRTDFDRFYFVTGQMDLDLYEEDCTFADPFVAFKGRERFKVRLGVFFCVRRCYLSKASQRTTR